MMLRDRLPLSDEESVGDERNISTEDHDYDPRYDPYPYDRVYSDDSDDEYDDDDTSDPSEGEEERFNPWSMDVHYGLPNNEDLNPHVVQHPDIIDNNIENLAAEAVEPEHYDTAEIILAYSGSQPQPTTPRFGNMAMSDPSLAHLFQLNETVDTQMPGIYDDEEDEEVHQDQDKFKCFYLLVETAYALRQREQEESQGSREE